ncbi:transcriptional regulator BolA [Holospora obtusa F1]|uniref:Transcriptional regulator BolA n=1 Tax=Holospora obtusa F1 TaxID=1399147 RepID=W6TT77_HOLOB|nr:BolA family protein [Holospora obtusa]ETZ06972.1 transcriptional regulator BolA [Holospora obtusa F1]
MSTTDISIFKTNVDWLHDTLLKAFPGAYVKVEDFKGDDQHLHAHIVTELFQNIALLDRHKQVYKILEGHIGHRIHALSLNTQTQKEASL